MAILPIQLLGQPVLREHAEPVTEFDEALRALIADMFETMDAALGAGLAANQIGLARRLAVIDAEEERFVMVNPKIIEASGKVPSEEGCLSIPELYGEVERSERIVLEAQDGDGNVFRKELDGLASRAVQHEIDHLDGVMFIDYLSPLKRQLAVRRWKRDNAGKTSWVPSPEESKTSE